MNRKTLTLMLLGAGASFAMVSVAQEQRAPATDSGEKQVYTTVGEHGERVYTDQKLPGAKPIEVDSAQTYKAQQPIPNNSAQSGRSLAPVRPDQNFRYDSCGITQPSSDQTFVNPESVMISARATPDVRPGDVMTILVDGTVVGTPGSPTAKLTPVLRGSHSTSVVIRDPRGVTLCTSPAVTFHARQPTVSTGERARQNTAQPRVRP